MLVKALALSTLLYSAQLPQWCQNPYYDCRPLNLDNLNRDRDRELRQLQQQLLQDQRRDDLDYRLDSLQWDIWDLKDQHLFRNRSR